MSQQGLLDRPQKLVVAGLITDGDRILITQRMASQAMPLKWEFPGGKIEHGESPVQALRRELLEEIGVPVQIGRIWDVLYHAYPAFDLLMLIYVCAIESGQPSCCEVEDLAWVLPRELTDYDILAADAPVVRRLGLEGAPSRIIV